MKLLTGSTATHDREPSARLSPGGLVDNDTAAADDVILWTDAQTRAVIERAATAARLTAIKRLRVA